MRLPNVQSATVPERKITHYLLGAPTRCRNYDNHQ